MKNLSRTYVSFYLELMKYLQSIYIDDFRERFVKCFTNRVLHFDIITTSRDENDHAVLKRRLRLFIEDLKTMMNDISLLLTNEHHNHLLTIEKAKIRFFMILRALIFQQVRLYVTSNALKMILNQYNLLTERSTAISFCTHVFIITTELSCSHKFQERLYNDDFILLKDVHMH